MVDYEAHEASTTSSVSNSRVQSDKLWMLLPPDNQSLQLIIEKLDQTNFLEWPQSTSQVC